ncbi:MAG: hypothetical protein WCG53_03900 [Actinomycetes bacterium]|jgi:hypothetical protein
MAQIRSYPRIGDLRNFTKNAFPISVAMIIDGFCEDAIVSINSIKQFAPNDCAILVIVSGTPDITGLEESLDERTFITQISGGVGWGEAANALLKLAPSEYVVIMDPSTQFTGDAITPALTALTSGEWAAVGWHGGLVNVEDEWRSVDDRGPGEVDVLFSYFMALNRNAAVTCGAFNIRAIYYRNADMEFSLRLRQSQGRLLQMELPLFQGRHHGYYDTEESFRETQSKKNYDRILDRFRGKNQILVERR